MPVNWIDVVILVTLVYYIISGWQTGIIYLAESFVSYLISLWLALRYHAAVGMFLSEKFGVSSLWSTVLGYLVIGFISQMVMSEILRFLLLKIPKSAHRSKVNSWLGAFVSLFNACVVVTFVLIVLLALPLRGTLKADIQESKLATVLVQLAQRYGGGVTDVVGNAAHKAVTFFTVEPTSKERVDLDVHVTPADLSVDVASEDVMLSQVNQERKKVGAQPLVLDTEAREIARAYSKDMFLRKYFSHVSPEGKNVADRMKEHGLSYEVVGENLAYAPDEPTAHEGLMNSPGHKRNILDPEFEKIGIGAVDGGMNGKMFTQIFIKD